MKRMINIRSITAPVFGIKDVEFSLAEVKAIREFCLLSRHENKKPKDTLSNEQNSI
jgi:hypothetical protein